MNAEALEVLRQIAADLHALRDAVENMHMREPARSLKFQDRAAMQKIMPVLAANFSGRFNTWELVDCATVNDPLGANLRIVIGKRTAQEIGKLFQRAQDRDIDGFRLRRVGQDGNGARWECIANGSS